MLVLAAVAELSVLPSRLGAGLSAAAQAAPPPGGEATAVRPGPVRSGPVRPAATRWQWPVDGVPRIARRFEPPASRYGRGHRGVDLAVAVGSTIRTAGPGVVVFAGPVAGRGVVSVTHAAGLRTTYEPVAPLVRPGAMLAADAVIGRLAPGHAPGLAACAEGCLHWGLRSGDDYLDPLSLLGSGPVRLYPVGGDRARGP
jgi:murein DD-endopeptidase MepM/ murein hydrolase activator NlpD